MSDFYTQEKTFLINLLKNYKNPKDAFKDYEEYLESYVMERKFAGLSALFELQEMIG